MSLKLHFTQQQKEQPLAGKHLLFLKPLKWFRQNRTILQPSIFRRCLCIIYKSSVTDAKIPDMITNKIMTY